MADKKKTLVVTGHAVAIYVAGAIRYLYRGDVIPAQVDDPKHIKALEEMGFVGDPETVTALAVKRAAARRRPFAEAELKVAAETTEEASGSDDDVQIPEGDPSEAWTIAQLKAFAKNGDLELNGATAKADILAAVIAAKPAA